jgi:MFS family permease
MSYEGIAVSASVSMKMPWYAWIVFRCGRPLVLVAALLMSIPGEIHLAEVAGWSHDVAKLMPVCVSAYAACSAVIADVAKRRQLPNRWSALIGAGVALALALSAQVISHLISENYMHSQAYLVAAVSAVPPLVVAHMLHMAAAPVSLTSVAEVPEVAAVDEDESGQLSLVGAAVGVGRRARRGGKVGKSAEEVMAAAEQVAATGQKVTAESLGQALGLSARQGRRYMAMVTTA